MGCRQQARAKCCRADRICLTQDSIASAFKARQGHRECKADHQCEESKNGPFQS